MKKLVLIVGMIIGIAFLASSVHAQTTQSPDKATKDQTTQTDQNTKGKFVDKDGDGVCDYAQKCRNQGKCAKFLDENGDGVCDNCKGNENCCMEKCCGKGMKKGDCPGMNPKDCCGKGHQHRHGMRKCQQTKSSKPEKK